MSMDTDIIAMSSISNIPNDLKPTTIRRASLVMKPPSQSPASSPGPNSVSTPATLTSKEWIVPPRPKPGRKPATDTPPTKRKAQNRAAQRAFRERRAARVGELEEQMKGVEDEHARQQEILKTNIERLEKEVENYRADLVTWMDRCKKLEKALAVTKSGESTLENNEVSQTLDSRKSYQESQDDNTAIGCGKCTLETRCQCIDDAFIAINETSTDAISQHEKRPQSPRIHSSEKRVKTESKEDLEIDFTSLFASKSQARTQKIENTSPDSTLADLCGFCSDGTPCICAEMAAEQQLPEVANHQARSLHASDQIETHRFSRFTPPPSEDDVSISDHRNIVRASCANGPGTCEQCQTDPNSTLFCKSLAASRSQLDNTTQGCCGGTTSTSSCCQSIPLPPRTTRSRTAVSEAPQKSGVTLTCADAYATLSRHSGYDKASDEMASWMPKLHATDSTKMIEGRPALEIDAANVMTVLRDFDRRFG